MAEEKKAIRLPHNLILEDRRLLTVSAVNDIDSFDEQTIVIYTDMGELTVKGEDLHINKLNVETGELNIEGKISAFLYSEEQAQKSVGLFAKLFK